MHVARSCSFLLRLPYTGLHTADGKAEDEGMPPEGLTKMEQMKWKREQKKKVMAASGAVTAFGAAPGGVPKPPVPGLN